MHFQIHQHATPAGAPHAFYWVLEKKEGNVCQSAGSFDTEKQTRSDIAAAKKSMKGAGRCKVLSPDEESV